MILALVSSGRSKLGDLGAGEAWTCRRRRHPRPPRPGALPPVGSALAKAVAAHGHHLLGVGGLHRGDGIAGIDRPGEGIGAFDRKDVADLHHVEQRGDARGDVLAVRRGGRKRTRRGRPSARPPAARRSRPAARHRRHRRRAAPWRRRRSSRRPAAAAAAAPLPATSTCTSPSLAAAVTTASVASFSAGIVMLGIDQDAHCRHSHVP